MQQVNKVTFKNAVFIMDTIQGTIDIDRIVEDRCLNRPDPTYHNIYGHRMVHIDTQKRWWQDVAETSNILDEHGHYWHRGNTLIDPRKIAEAMVQDGITWVRTQMVIMAQKRKAK